MFANLRTLGQATVAACVLVGWSGNWMAGAQSVCADLGGTVDPDQICRAHIVGSGYTLDLSFPVDYPDQQPLTDYLTHTRDEWVHDAQTQPPVDRPPYVLVVTGDAYRSGTPTSGTQSVVLGINQDFGAHPVGSFKAFTYDRGKGAPVTFDTLFKPGTNPLGVAEPDCPAQVRPAAVWRPRGGRIPELRDHRRRGDLLLQPGTGARAARRATKSLGAPRRTRVTAGLALSRCGLMAAVPVETPGYSDADGNPATR